MARSRTVHHGRASAAPRREPPFRDPKPGARASGEGAASPPRPPRRFVYALTERERGGTRWLRVGVAFLNRDGSVAIYLDAVPLSGKLQVREELPKDEISNPAPPPPATEGEK